MKQICNEVVYETHFLTIFFCSVASGSPCDFSWTVETDECVSNAAVVEKCTQPNTSCQDGFSITSSHLRMDEIYQHEMPVNDEKYRQSHSVALQNEVNQLNSKDKQKCLKETQSLVTQKNSRDSFECLLNVIVTGTLNPDKSSHYSSSDGSDHASCAIYSSGTPKKVSNPNDADITNNVTEANITVSTQTRKYMSRSVLKGPVNGVLQLVLLDLWTLSIIWCT